MFVHPEHLQPLEPGGGGGCVDFEQQLVRSLGGVSVGAPGMKHPAAEASSPSLSSAAAAAAAAAAATESSTIRETEKLLQAELQTVRLERNELARERAGVLRERAELREARAALQAEVIDHWS